MNFFLFGRIFFTKIPSVRRLLKFVLNYVLRAFGILDLNVNFFKSNLLKKSLLMYENRIIRISASWTIKLYSSILEATWEASFEKFIILPGQKILRLYFQIRNWI